MKKCVCITKSSDSASRNRVKLQEEQIPVLIKLDADFKVAQLEAHMTQNHVVAGSNPAFVKSWFNEELKYSK